MHCTLISICVVYVQYPAKCQCELWNWTTYKLRTSLCSDSCADSERVASQRYTMRKSCIFKWQTVFLPYSYIQSHISECCPYCNISKVGMETSIQYCDEPKHLDFSVASFLTPKHCARKSWQNIFTTDFFFCQNRCFESRETKRLISIYHFLILSQLCAPSHIYSIVGHFESNVPKFNTSLVKKCLTI